MTVLAMALLACGAPTPRDSCTADAQCGAGQYCAAGGVCWPDAVAPVIDSVTAACAAPCLRDSTVAVAVAAHDDVRLAGVTARLDLAPAVVVPLTLQGGTWRADLALASWPFPAFERTVEVTVEARDSAGNTVTSARTVGPATRLRWAVDFAPGEPLVPVPGAVAVDDQGTAVFGATNGKVHYIGTDGVAKRGPVSVGAGFVTAPIVIGSDGVWVPSDDGKVYRVPADLTAAIVTDCDTGAPVKGIALGLTAIPVSASSSGAFFSKQVSVCRNSNPYTGEVFFPPIAVGPSFYGAEGANLHDFTFNTYGLFLEAWTSPASLPSPISAPLAIGAGGDLLALTTPAAGGNSLFSISPAGVVTPLAATGVPADGPVVRANGDIVVPEKGKVLTAWTSAGTLRWTSAALTGVPLTPLLLAGGGDALVVADGRGSLTALDDAGRVRWTVQLAPTGTALHAPNLHAPPGATLSTGYVPAANGKLYAVILDGRLDAAAPWPKAFHDPRNTGNSATAQPPP
jgi:outer membrane protein assembly factor BamB